MEEGEAWEVPVMCEEDGGKDMRESEWLDDGMKRAASRAVNQAAALGGTIFTLSARNAMALLMRMFSCREGRPFFLRMSATSFLTGTL